MLKEFDMSWIRVVAISGKDVKCIHYGYHCVDHSVHELTYNLAIWVLRTLDCLFRCSRTVHLGAKQISLQDEELEMTRSARDLAVIERLTKNADTQEKKVSLTRFA